MLAPVENSKEDYSMRRIAALIVRFTVVFFTIAAIASAQATTGTINFHLLLGDGSSEESLTLDGGNYTDLIMSNMIAGVMYGHLVQEYAGVSGIQYNKDYLYGSIMAQLLQENIATEDYESSSDLIDPLPDQQAVMSVGQGGPIRSITTP